ncbi:MAG: murein L,D-transpeptidase catalytic domain family protein [Sediminibacterium sp.]
MNVRKRRLAVMIGSVMLTAIILLLPPAIPLRGNDFTAIKSNDPSGKLALYEQLGLGALGLSKSAFVFALNGWNALLKEGKIRKDNILSILDFSLPSGQKRMFVIDLEVGRLLFNTYVSHGRNSGKEIPTRFSNRANSNQSSLGFFVTQDTYRGKHGTSLRLHGEESGINDNALHRGIVVHGADYVSDQVAERQGFVGRSQGCPAIPPRLTRPIIDHIKEGSCFFIYSPDASYLRRSPILRPQAQRS